MWWHADYMSESFQAPFGYFITDGGRKMKPLPDFLIPYLVHEAYARGLLVGISFQRCQIGVCQLGVMSRTLLHRWR